MMFKKLGLGVLGCFLVLLGVNIAPTVYSWQGQAYDWTFQRAAPPPGAKVEVAPDPAMVELVGQLRAVVEQRQEQQRQEREKRQEPAPAPTPAPPPPAVPALADRELDTLRGRVKALEEDQKRLTELVLATQRELNDRREPPPPAPVAAPVGTFDELMANIPVGRITMQQEHWLHAQKGYAALRQRGMSDYLILRRIGNPEVWKLGQ